MSITILAILYFLTSQLNMTFQILYVDTVNLLIPLCTCSGVHAASKNSTFSTPNIILTVSGHLLTGSSKSNYYRPCDWLHSLIHPITALLTKSVGNIESESM